MLLILALTLLPLRMLNMNEAAVSPINPADIAEKANAAVINVTNTTPEGVYSPQNVFEVWVTAYASVPQETDNTPFITASNKHVEDGFIAANFLPFGTKVQIPSLFGNKIFTVEDRMNIRKAGFVDIWMPTVAAAKDFGINRAPIVVLNDPAADHIAEK